MPAMKLNRKNPCLPLTRAILLAVVIAWSTPAVGRGGTVASIELVPLLTAGPGDTTTTLPSPLIQVAPGEPFVVEIWARTGNSQGISSASMTIQFDPSVAIVTSVNHTTLFSSLPNGEVDNVAGLVVGLSGSHLSTCADQVGVMPTWARVAVLDMQAADSGSLVVTSADTGIIAFGTAICGVGDLLPSQVAYGAATLTVTGPPIPTVSQWGLIALTLMLLTAGTIIIKRRSLPIGRGRSFRLEQGAVRL